MEDPFKNKIEDNSSPVPKGVNPEYFWKVVNIIAWAKPSGGEDYKTGSIQAFNAARMKSGKYEPFMKEIILQAQKEVLDPNSKLSEANLAKEGEGVWTPKRDLLSDAYDKKFSPDQTHADLGGESTRID